MLHCVQFTYQHHHLDSASSTTSLYPEAAIPITSTHVYLGLCRRSGSSGSSRVGGSSPCLPPPSSPPSPGLWLLSVSPSPPSSPWLSACPLPPPPSIGVFVRDWAWRHRRVEVRRVRAWVSNTWDPHPDPAARPGRRFGPSRRSSRPIAFQCRFLRIQICPMLWLCAALTCQRLPVSTGPPQHHHGPGIETKRGRCPREDKRDEAR